MKRIDGVAIGLVSEVDAKLGRVKVKFPWMDPPQASYWAPIASLLSGKKRGARFMPELEDEALIAFDRGEFDHPYVVGFLWNGADEAPDDVKSNRLVVTPGGHELRFEDKSGDRRVVLKTSDGHKLTLDDKAGSVTLESKGGHKLEVLDQDGKVTLATKSGGKVTLEDQPGKAVVEASQNKITLAPEGITIEVGLGVLNIKSTAVTNIEALGLMNVKSSAVMNVNSTAAMNIETSAVLNLKAAGIVNLTAALLNVSAPMATFSGVVQATAIIATAVVSSSYTPGLGNIL
jgi:phage baseplate assembly protein gpV